MNYYSGKFVTSFIFLQGKQGFIWVLMINIYNSSQCLFLMCLKSPLLFRTISMHILSLAILHSAINDSSHF